MSGQPEDGLSDEDKALLVLSDDVCSAIESDDFGRANELAISLQTQVRQRLATTGNDEPVTANLLSILKYVSARQQDALKLSSRKKRDVAQSIRKHRRGADGVSSYMSNVR